MTTNFVFIDSRVADYQSLVAGLVQGTEWYLINADEDGVEQMARVLSGRTGLDSIQIVSHGSSGSVLLGATALDTQSLAVHAEQLAQIGTALTDTGDILLYGCNIAAGAGGQQFISELSKLTGADVAASVDFTGAAFFDGNWLLEANTGSIEATVLNIGNDYQSILSDDYAGDTSTTGRLTASAPISAAIDFVGDKDCFKVYLTAGTGYIFEQAQTPRTEIYNLDSYLELYSPNVTYITYSDDFANLTDRNSRIEYVATVSGDYYLLAQAAPSTFLGTYTGSYQLSMSVNRAPVASGKTVSYGIDQSIAATALFNAYDPDGNSITSYALYDPVGSGYFEWSNSTGITWNDSSRVVTVQASSLGYVTYHTGAGSENIQVSAADWASWGAWATTTVSANQVQLLRSDLVIWTLMLDTYSVAAGGSETVNFAIANNGNATAAPTTTKLYLSTDAFVDASDTLISTFSTPSLGANQSSTGSFKTTIPSNLAAGTYNFIVAADTANVVTNETSETNNVFAQSFSVTPATRPDLVIGTLTPSAHSVAAGGTETVTFSIVNTGNATAAPTTAKLYLSSDALIDPSDHLISAFSFPSLGPNQSSTGNFTTTIPPYFPAGTYNFIVAADTANVVTNETSETNNVFAQSFTVTPEVRPAPYEFHIISTKNYGHMYGELKGPAYDFVRGFYTDLLGGFVSLFALSSGDGFVINDVGNSRGIDIAVSLTEQQFNAARQWIGSWNLEVDQQRVPVGYELYTYNCIEFLNDWFISTGIDQSIFDRLPPTDVSTMNTGLLSVGNYIGQYRNTFSTPGSSTDDTLAAVGNKRNIIFGLAGNDTIYGSDSALFATPDNSDVLVGGNGTDTLFGGSGIDRLFGGIGNDVLNGGIGNDICYGGDGNDTLAGGSDDDVLMGGNGADRLRFLTPREGTDSITDFLSGTDSIQIVSANFAKLPLGVLSASRFVAASNPQPLDGNAVFLYNTTTGLLSFDNNGNRWLGVSDIAILTGSKALVASDFQVISDTPTPIASTLTLRSTGVQAGVTAKEVVSIALANIGSPWAASGCDAFVWGVTNLAGLRFFDLADKTRSGNPQNPQVSDYDVPHSAGKYSGTAEISGDGWDLVSGTNSASLLSGILQPGDVVRLYKSGNTDEDSWAGAHSFIVASSTGGNVQVVDNWNGSAISQHSFSDIANSWAPTGQFEAAFVSRLGDRIHGTNSTTAVLPIGTILGTIEQNDVSGSTLDVDYYKVTLAGGHKYTLIANSRVSASDTLDSVIIRLRDSAGNALPNNMVASGSNPNFDFTPASSDTYHLEINASSVGSNNGIAATDKTGQYQITLIDKGIPPLSVGNDNFTTGGTFDFPLGDQDSQSGRRLSKTEANDKDGYHVTSGFGFYDPTIFASNRDYHLGEDWNKDGLSNADLGEAVYAVADGKVVWSRGVNGFGDVVIIKHLMPNGEYGGFVTSLYGHLSNLQVAVGQQIHRGDQIGVIANYPLGPHLHFEIRAGINPAALSPDHGYSETPRPNGWLDPTDFILSHQGNASVVASDSIQQAALVGTSGQGLSIQASTKAGTNLIVGAQGQYVVVSDNRTGNVQMQAEKFTELAFEGGAGKDILRVGPLSGTDVADHTVFFNGMDGNDKLDASTADKSVVASGGNGNDSLSGGSANDMLSGNEGNDVLLGGLGNDIVDGGTGADTMTGGAGNDTFFVDNSTDKVIESEDEGTDIVLTVVARYSLAANIENLSYLGAGNFAGAGNALDNTIVGGNGNDTLNGGLGSDTVIVTGNRADYVFSRPDVGKVQVTRNDGTETDLMTGIEQVKFADGSIGQVTLDDLLKNTASKFDDNYGGGDDANVFDGLAGNDSILGGGENDSLSGGLGNDTLDGGTGSDQLSGGLGNDLYLVDTDAAADPDPAKAIAGDVVSEAQNAGIDKVQTSLTAYVLGNNIENMDYLGTPVPVLGSDGKPTGTSQVQQLAFTGTGNNLANTITGSLGNDTLDGGLGVDKLIGGAGDDTYVVDRAASSLINADGNSVYVPGDQTLEQDNAGIDTVRASTTNWMLAANVENLLYTGSDGFRGTGNLLANLITGNSGNDTLSGLAENDILNGMDGNDRLLGGDGNDVLNGGQGDDNLNGGNDNDRLYGNEGSDLILGGIGDDTLAGGVGADTLTGGVDADNFVFNNSPDANSIDLITDFKSGVDHLSLDVGNFGIADLNQAGLLVANVAEITADTRLIYQFDGKIGTLYYDDDGLGEHEMVAVAKLTGVGTLAATDFAMGIS